MTNWYCSETMTVIAALLLMGDVVIGVGPGVSPRGRPVTGHDPRSHEGRAGF
jgi:hypothetical protein